MIDDMNKSYVGMYQCFFCGENIGILMDRRLKNTIPMHAGILNMDPCDKCKEYMKHGIILISVEDSTTEEDMKGPIPNPHRTGGWAVVKEEAIKRLPLNNKKLVELALKHRFIFLTSSAWNQLGLEKIDENAIR